VSLLHEELPADAASEGLLVGVQERVAKEVSLLTEAPAAGVASEGPHLRVDILVNEQMTLLAEHFAAHLALEGPLGGGLGLATHPGIWETTDGFLSDLKVI